MPSGYFNLRLPAISDALNVQYKHAKPIISGFFSTLSVDIIPPKLFL
jgi:hypothetical protein